MPKEPDVIRIAASTALCSAVAVAVATEITWDDGTLTQLVAGGVALLLVLGAALVLTARSRPVPVAADAPPAPPAPARTAASENGLAGAARTPLLAQLERGTELRQELRHGGGGKDVVEQWIDETAATLQRVAPQFVPYFSGRPTLGAGDAASLLERQLARLGTIVHESL